MYIYLVEIKNRLLYLIISWFLISIILFFYKDCIIYFILKPCITKKIINNFYFIYTNLTEVISVYLKLVFFLGFYLSYPHIIYHLWKFIYPIFYIKNLKKNKLLLLLFSLFWFILNIILYIWIIPNLWEFFLNIGSNNYQNPVGLHFEAKFNEYINFIIQIYIISNILFQFFFSLITLILKKNQYNLRSIKQLRKISYFFFLIFATIITPPDIIDQIIIIFALSCVIECILIIVIIKNEFFFLKTYKFFKN